jgi:hypothetical protein
MPEKPRYLLGKAERLTRPVFISQGSGPKVHPYEWAEQRARLAPQAARVAGIVADLPQAACPEDRSVGVLTLHPSYFAKSYFPTDLLRASELRPVGSRPIMVKPDKGKAGASTAIFVAGKRQAFKALAETIPRLDSRNTDLLAIESLRVPSPQERLRLSTDSQEQTLEVILHAPTGWDSVVEGFDAYLGSLGLQADISRRHYVRDLCFMPVHASSDQLLALGLFSFLRVARTMPRLREMRPASALTVTQPQLYTLPDAQAMDAGIRVAIFDGGLSSDSPLTKWAVAKEASNLGPAAQEFLDHGTDVTSAALFGSLHDSLTAPYFNVEHYRVLDERSYDSNGEYYDVLDRIVEVLGTQHFDFVNLSVGPHLPIEDDEIHPWTAKLDEMLSDGKTLLVSAVGNDGELDRLAGLARIQPPSDGVNLLSVGAATLPGAGWERASYSCIGPGRSPGLMKPDVMSFGGCKDRPFWVAAGDVAGSARPTCGTSFAAPNVLRIAAGLRAHFGSSINPLAIRALLLHHAEPLTHSPVEVGWGAIPENIQALVECPPGTAYILYQGILEPRQHLRADIPLPNGDIPGYISIRATFCIATDIDPEDSSNYTRSGLIPTFRPNKDRRTPKFDADKNEWRTPVHPDSASFFKLSNVATEQELRNDALKWETVLRREKRFRGSTLNDPMFDIHFNPREGGADASNPKPIPYALVVTVKANSVPHLYDRIATRYRTQLEALQPVIEIPIRTRTDRTE